MSSRSWSKVKSLFFAASGIDPADRSAFLAQHSDDNTEVRDQVRKLLKNRDEAGSFLSRPATPSGGDAAVTESLETAPAQFVPGEIVGSRYLVRRFLARGGMGEVYEADDLEMDLTVAIKTLRPSAFGGDALLSRFKREVDLARRVTHPNIGRIFDIGHHNRADGENIPFLTMEFLEGETLAQHIRRGGPIPEAEALPLVREIVQALDAIHQTGIVHRDFKSANVMLVPAGNGQLHARVMDFGLARPAALDGSTLTRTGLVSGTPAYMAPEQFENVSTAASDIYALGVVLHETLLGVRPNVQPSPITSTALGAFSPWPSILRRCLARDPAERFQNAGELLRALPVAGPEYVQTRPARSLRVRAWLSIAAVLLILAGISGLAWWRGNQPSLSAGPPKHLALLPIHSDSPDPSDTAFCAGFSDTLRGDLAEMETASKGSLWVIPSAEVRTLKSASEAYHELGADLVIDVTFRRAGNGATVTAELVDARNQHLLKSTTIEANTLLELRPAALNAFAALLDIRVAPGATREVAQSGTAEPGAFDFYEQGLGYLRGDGLHNIEQAIELFRRALAKDQNYPLAYAGLGEAYAARYELTRDPQWVQPALENGQKATRLNGRLPQAYATMGLIYRMTGHSDQALKAFQQAIQVQPGCTACYYQLGVTYGQRGEWADAERSFRAVVRQEHGNLLGYSGLGWTAHAQGNLAMAAQMYEKALALAPDRARSAANLGGVYTEMERFEEAVPLLQKSVAAEPFAQAYSNLSAALMYTGRYEEARDASERAVQLTPNNHDYWRNLGDCYRMIPALRGDAVGAYRHALQHAEASLVVKPDDSDLLSSIGLYYAHLGAQAKAESYMNRALKAAPNDSSVLFTAGLIKELTGRPKDAIKSLAASAKAGYSVSLIDKEPELSKLRRDPAYQMWIKQVRSSGTSSH